MELASEALRRLPKYETPHCQVRYAKRYSTVLAGHGQLLGNFEEGKDSGLDFDSGDNGGRHRVYSRTKIIDRGAVAARKAFQATFQALESAPGFCVTFTLISKRPSFETCRCWH